MNVLHMRYAVEVAKTGSLSKASENLLIAVPNISRSIKELELDIGITIFDRTNKGMNLTPDGEEFINYAKGILGQLDQIERFYKNGSPQKQRFSISVPRACYISDAFVNFSKSIGNIPTEIFYKETNSQRTINNILKFFIKSEYFGLSPYNFAVSKMIHSALSNLTTLNLTSFIKKTK